MSIQLAVMRVNQLNDKHVQFHHHHQACWSGQLWHKYQVGPTYLTTIIMLDKDRVTTTDVFELLCHAGGHEQNCLVLSLVVYLTRLYLNDASSHFYTNCIFLPALEL